MKTFSITKEEAIKVISFNRIRTGGYDIPQFYVSRDTLEIYFSISLTKGAKAKVKVDIINNDDSDYWFSANFDDFILAMDNYDADLTIGLDARIGLKITDGMKGKLTSIIQYDVEPVELWPVVSSKSLTIDPGLIKALKPFVNALKVSDSCGSILMDDDKITTSDSAIAAYLPFPVDGKTCVPIRIVPILEQFIDCELFHVVGGFVLQSDNYQFFLEEAEPPDIPTDAELAKILPDSSNSHQLSINTSTFKEVLKGFKFKDNWRWGLVRFNYGSDDNLYLSWSNPKESHRDCIPVTNMGATDYGEFILPTKMIKAFLPLFGDDFTLTYNSGNPRDEHHEAVLIESGHLTLAVCKIIVAGS